MDQPNPQPPQQVSVSSAQFIASAMLLTPWILAGVATYLVTVGGMENGALAPGSTTGLLKTILLFLGIGMIPVSYAFRRILAGNASQSRDMARAFSISFISMGIAESAAVFGFIIAILTGDLMIAGILWGIGFAGMLFHWPTRRWLEGR
jgi:F0F1-type ATP synthase membrane subunit c/vacuolar-type H+-ATPase subunit K